MVPPFQVKVIGAIAENDQVLSDADWDVPPLFSQTVTEYVNYYYNLFSNYLKQIILKCRRIFFWFSAVRFVYYKLFCSAAFVFCIFLP